MDLIARKWRQNKAGLCQPVKGDRRFIAENKGKIEGFERGMEHLEKALHAYYEIREQSCSM